MKPDDLIQVEPRSVETMSETSEGTTTTSLSGPHGFESREELLELVETLRLSSLEELHRERFRVDRRKLENMLLGDDETPESASMFFRKIMDETNTVITWPSRLKIGAKSKKDPHIKVAGRVDDVGAAKEKIMQILDTRQSMRVTMKLDVSYTDHSHIIGKGGLTIKRVMEETACHIHFPDSNRSNHQEKSNQVSIAGEMEGVEKARARVRNLTPLIFSFELPIMGAMQGHPDSTSPYIVKIQEKYNVQVMFRTRPKLHATLVVVKGCEWEVLQVKEATVFLIHHMCKNLANQIQVQMSMEISPQHHSIVLGKQSSNLKMIMQRTSTQIIFPDAGDPNIPSLKKSNVIITGAINNVYMARQQLLGSLPLVLMFDLPETSRQSVDTETISQLMQTLDVFINVLHKPKQSSLSVIIKGVERNATSIYEARRQLLSLDDAKIVADIPPTYNIPNSPNVFQSTLNGSLVSDKFTNFLTINTQSPSPYCVSPLPHSPNPINMSPHWGLPPIPSMFSPLMHHPFAFPNANAQLLAARHAMQANILSQQQAQMNLPGQNLLGIAQSHPPGFPPNSHYGSNSCSLGPKSGSDGKDTSAYLSLSSASSTLSSPAVSPRNISPIGSSHTDLSQSRDLSAMLSDLSMGEKKGFNPSAHLTAYDYEQKKILAMKAMKSKPNPNEYRVPTPTWAGYGLSQTMPTLSPSESQKARDASDLWDDPSTPLVYAPSMKFEGEGEGECPTPIAMTSTYLDHTPRSRLEKILNGSHTDLASAMINAGLDKKWIELKKRTKPFSGSAAPGAERRASLTIPSAPNGNSVEGKW
ncbi:protein bicaudal C homolog 1-A isoform X2 [Diachasma alloeum]|uniref:protein bicaudal C homolog 1-A isoform X2 n=1 Tax=Diachasma alloeum TaxID=454923 RepID=UPI0007381A8E|nr:protein bicaudal C homolog 1-A isoform X2 [Diachasma alloeum]